MWLAGLFLISVVVGAVGGVAWRVTEEWLERRERERQ